MTYESKAIDIIENIPFGAVFPIANSRWDNESAAVDARTVERRIAASLTSCDIKWARGRAGSICSRLRVAPSLREEAISEGLIAAHRAALKYDIERNVSLRAYLHSVIRCSVIDYLRKQHRYYRRHVALDLRVNESDEGRQDWESGISANSLSKHDEGSPEFIAYDNPESLLLRREHSARINSMIDKLPRRERAIVVEHYFNGKTLTEIGIESGHSKSLISSLHRRALIKLKHQFRMTQAGF